jgi:hypothetical protein
MKVNAGTAVQKRADVVQTARKLALLELYVELAGLGQALKVSKR